MNEVINYLLQNDYQFIKYNEKLSKHTTFKVGGVAAIVVSPESKNKIIDLIMFLNQEKIPFKIFGNGSNILPSDHYYEGVIIKTHKALDFLIVNEESIVVGAGYSLMKLAHDMARHELSGLEFIGGIPGTVGGAIYMNAGAYNKEMKDVVSEVKILNEEGQIVTYKNEELQYGYRESILQKEKPLLIIEATMKLQKGNKVEILTLLAHRKERRLETQPLEYPSGGSTFRNPPDTHAYQLIDQAGLRGYSIGGAKVSEKHCNFIINYDHALSQDIKDLVDYIIQKVDETYHIHLKPEIEFFNF